MKPTIVANQCQHVAMSSRSLERPVKCLDDLQKSEGFSGNEHKFDISHLTEAKVLNFTV